jgi:hypothetical protein
LTGFTVIIWSIAQPAELGGVYWITKDQHLSCAVVDNKLRFRSSDTSWNTHASVICNGKSISINGITSQAKANQLTCSNHSGGRMNLSSKTYTLNC